MRAVDAATSRTKDDSTLDRNSGAGLRDRRLQLQLCDVELNSITIGSVCTSWETCDSRRKATNRALVVESNATAKLTVSCDPAVPSILPEIRG